MESNLNPLNKSIENDSEKQKNKEPEVVTKKKMEFTSKFDIPIISETTGKSDIKNNDSDTTKAKDISNSKKPTRIIQNPKDNIRYMKRKETEKTKSRFNMENIINNMGKSEDISSDIRKNISDKTEDSLSISGKLSSYISSAKERKELHKKRKRGSHRIQVEVKATPDIDFFSMTFDELSENPVEPLYVNHNNEDEKIYAENAYRMKSNIEDYEKPEDAESVLSDMYDLQTTLHSRIIVLIVMMAICLYVSLADSNGFPIFNTLKSSVSPHGFIFIQLITAIVSCAVSFTSIFSGIKKIFKRHTDGDSLSAIVMLSSFISGVVMLFDTKLIEMNMSHLYISSGIASLLFNAIGKYLIVDRAICNFEYVSDSKREKYAMFCVDDEDRAEKITRGIVDDYPVVATSRKTGFLTDFLKYTYSSDISDRFCNHAVPAFTMFSLITALIFPFVCDKGYSGNIISACLWIFSMCLSMSSCLAVPIVVNLPLHSVSKEYSKTSGLMLGYQSIEDFYDTNAIVTDISKIFPEKCVSLVGIKMFSESKIDDAIIYAGSMATYSNSILTGIFNSISDGKEDMYSKVESCVYEEKLGLCGWLNNKRILFGTRNLMEKHSIENLPPKSLEDEYERKGFEAIYLSVSGNLSAIFIIKLKADPEIKYWLSEMKEHKIKLIVKCNDAFINSKKISTLFGMPEKSLKMLRADCHKEFDIETQPVAKVSASMAYEGNISTMIKLITDSGSLRRNFVVGLSMQCAGAILGIIFSLVFMCMGSAYEITPIMVMAYNIIWTIIISLLVKSRIF